MSVKDVEITLDTCENPNSTNQQPEKSQFDANAANNDGGISKKCLYILMAIIGILISVLCFCLIVIYEKEANVTHSIDAWKDSLSKEQSEWFKNGLEELKFALNVQSNTKRAKNVILFVGDGMGVNTLTASRIYKYGEEGRLVWETFPHMGMLKVCLMYWLFSVNILFQNPTVFFIDLL